MHVLHIQSVIIFLYAVFSLIVLLKINWKAKALIIAAVAVCEFKFAIYTMFGGRFDPDLPRCVVMPIETGSAVIMLAVMMAIVKDAIGLTSFLLRKVCKVHVHKIPHHPVNVVILAIAMVGGVTGIAYQFKTPDVYTSEVEIKGLEIPDEELRLVQISDIHIGPILKRGFTKKVVERVNTLKPDIIVITGDIVDGPTDHLRYDVEPLKDLKAKYGVYAVTGNHEYYSGAPEWVQELSMLNLKFLNNAHTQLEGTNITLGGVIDLRASGFGLGEPDIDGAFAGSGSGPKILLAHQPRTAVGYEDRIDLILSGHTHGGSMIFLRPLVAAFNNGYVSGMYRSENGNYMYVSNGTGIWSGFSCRIFVPSEIGLFLIKRGVERLVTEQ